MGLFVKRSEVGNHAPLYTTSANKTVLIVGLGNPGKEYKETRHNIGFAVLDELCSSLNLGAWTTKKDLKCELVMGVVGDTRVIAIKPTTFMNASGEAVQAVCHFYKLSASDVLVIHDELDIDFGKIRTSINGSAAGHNGIKSVIEHLGDAFGRIRVGIGPKKPAKMDSADFVLGKFTATHMKAMPEVVQEAVSMTNDYIASGSLFVETRTVLF